MSSSVQFLHFMLEREGGKLDSLVVEWEKQKGRRQEFERQLDYYNLKEIQNRNKFFWDLQLVIEDVLINEEYPDHDTLTSLIAEKWNAKFPEVKITAEVAHKFLQNFHYIFPNNQKAFKAICDGDFDAYTMFDKEPLMFMNMLNRLLIVEIGHFKTFSKISAKVARTLFNKEEVEKTINHSFIDLRFMIGNGRMIFPKMNKFRSLYTADDFVFAKGVKSILKEKLAIDLEVEKQISEEKAAARQAEKERSTEGEQKPAVEASESVEKVVEPAVQNVETQGAEPSELQPEAADTELGTEKMPTDDPMRDDSLTALLEKEFTALKEKILEKFEENVAAAAPVSNQPDPVIPALEISPQYVSALEEENARLKAELAAEQQKSDQVYEKTITEFIQSIAGKQANYILSDLYQETNSPSPDNYMQIVGQLMNLFSEWSMLGLEPHSLGKEIGEIFTVSKKELANQFMVTAPISSPSADFSVKLVKYGWSFNGKVLVQPAVEEIKEVRQ